MNHRIKRDWTLHFALYLLGLSAHFKRALNLVGGEKRKYPRCAISIRATRVNTGSFSFYHALNIGVGGIFLKSQEPPPVGTELKLRFSLFPSQPEIEVNGVVVWVRNPLSDFSQVPGMGVKFTRISAEVQKTIGTFMTISV